MSPDNVYVVYSQVADEVVSVHSTRSFALMARQDILNDVINRFMKTVAYFDEEDRQKIQLRYIVCTLTEAINYIQVKPDFVAE